MLSLVAKTTLVLCIIEAVASVPQQGGLVWSGPPNVQPFLQNIRQRNQQSLVSASSQPLALSGPQLLAGGVIFEGEQSGSNVNRRFPVANAIFNNLFNNGNTLNGRNNMISAQQTQLGWSLETNSCIIGNDDWSLDTPVALIYCKNQCQLQNGCRSVEWNTQTGICNLSKSNSRSPNFLQRCPTTETPWLFTELIEIPTQNEIQNQPSRPDDRFQKVGLSPTQNDFHQANQAPSLVQTVTPSPTNTNQQVGQTTQQSGSSVSQNGRPQDPQNGANEGNAATNLPQHFQPATQHATHSPNTAQVAGAGSPISSGSSQEKPSQCQRIPSPGECRGAFPRFFYNATMDQCDCFLYGGCGDEALDSSWLTLTECTDTCRPRNTQGGPRCRLLPKQDIQTFTQPSTIIQTPDTSDISDDQLIAGLLGQSNQQQNQKNN